MHGHDAAQPLFQELLQSNLADVTAATRLAANPKASEIHSLLGKGGTKEERTAFVEKLRQLQFQPDAIAHEIFGASERSATAKLSSAPIYLKPLRAGARSPPSPDSPLKTCIQLFLMAVCLPTDHCTRQLGAETVELMDALGIAHRCESSGLLVPCCHIMPVRIEEGSQDILYVSTDLHPNVLSTTALPNGDGAVMYIGPDSLALLDHCDLKNGWLSSSSEASTTTTVGNPPSKSDRRMDIVDIGCGSGIQGLRLVASSQRYEGKATKEPQVTSVDVNPRALAITKLNFEWNGLEAPRLVLGDIAQLTGGQIVRYNIVADKEHKQTTRKTSWNHIFKAATHILSNPPFLPVPVQEDVISKRYGLFSNGGASGEEVLQRIVELTAEGQSVDPFNKSLAIVSEFMNPDTQFSSKLKRWWKKGGNPVAEAFLFTNKEPLDAEEYSLRRADSANEAEQWICHMRNEEISTVSPGLLYIHSSSNKLRSSLPVNHHLVPKTGQGSIWTPTNEKARKDTQQVMGSFHGEA